MGLLLALLFFIFTIIIIVSIAVVVAKSLKRSEKSETNLPYAAKQYFFTQSEQVFYDILNAQLDAQRFTIFPKVRMGDYIEPTNQGKERWGSWNRIKSRHVDFIIWDLVNKEILMAIELDGMSHIGLKAQAADSFKDQVFDTVGTPLKRVRVGTDFEQEVRQIVGELKM